MSTDDLAGRLASMIADLDGYISLRAAELAQPMIDAVIADAEERVRVAEFETQRQQDIVGELRKRLDETERWLVHEQDRPALTVAPEPGNVAEGFPSSPSV